MPIMNPNGPDVTDDGTTILLSWESTKLLKINKSTGQLLVAAGVDTDQTL